MTNRLPVPPPGFDDLAVDEQIEYLEALWDRIAAKPEEVPVPQWHRDVIDERQTARRARSDQGRPWSEVRDELRRELRDRDA